MIYGCVCSGIAAATVAWEPLGWRPAWFAEIEKFPSQVLAHHYPRVPNMGDMTKLPALVRAHLIAAPDVLVGGTPCQAYSLAGLRAGLDDPRGQLTLTFVDLANAIDEQRPDDECVVYWENVPGVLSDKTNAFGCLLAGLAGESEPLVAPGGKWPNAGIVVGPQRTIAWRITDAQYFGVAQRRRRLFLVASARTGFDPGKLLFEFDGVRRDSAPSREAQESVTAGTLRSSDGGSDVDHALAGHILAYAPEVNATLETTSDDYSRADGFTALAYAFSCKDSGADAALNLAPTMRAMGHSGSHQNGGGQLAVCVTGSVTHCLKAEGFDASEDGTGRGQPITAVGPLWRVRRLTPRECERLQAFPDDYTLVPCGRKMAADGPRYKALGNSMCVFNMRWLGLRLLATHPALFLLKKAIDATVI